MLLLAGVSFMSWYYIFLKLVCGQGRRALRPRPSSAISGRAATSPTSTNSAVNDRHHAGSMERIFEPVSANSPSCAQKNLDPKDVIDGARAPCAPPQREMDALEAHLAFLASVGSVSPYIGLFGTVWGIMHSFRGLSNVGQATLAVAPGIAEALVATAIGLFAAIRRSSPTTAFARHRPPGDPLRVVHGRVFQHPPAADALSHAPAPPQKNEINVVPYIDVMLVLLVIFMVTGADDDDRQHDLPSVGKAHAPGAPLEVAIKADGPDADRPRRKQGNRCRRPAD